MASPEHESPLQRLTRLRTAERRERAIMAAQRASEALEEKGVLVRVIGSLARHDFSHGSDVDLLVDRCPRELKYAIEGIVEDCLGDLPFHVIYLDEIPAEKIERFTRDARHARDLR